MTSSTDDRRAASRRRGDLEGDPRLGERALGPDDPLGDGRLGDQEGARDLVGRQTSEQPQRERDPRLGREHRMAGDEHEAQQVVADVVVDRGVEVRRRRLLPDLELATELLVLALEQLAARRSWSIARCFAVAMSQAPGLSGTPDSGHCSSAATSASCARSSASADVAHDAREAGDEPGGLDPPDRVDRAMRIGSRHGSR